MFDRQSTEDLERAITEAAAQIAADTCQWLLMVAEFERREGHLDFGFHCCALWLSWRCSVTPRAAREQLRVARRLMDWRLVREAFSRGELSYSKVRAITRVDALELEQELLDHGSVDFRSPDGRLLPAAPRLGPLPPAKARDHGTPARRGFYSSQPVNGAIPIPASAGQPHDLGLTIAGLVERTAPAELAGPAP